MFGRTADKIKHNWAGGNARMVASGDVVVWFWWSLLFIEYDGMAPLSQIEGDIKQWLSQL